MELHKFIKTTLGHTANNAKVTTNAVQIAFETWKNSTEYDTSARSQLHDEYIKHFEATRNEYDIEYTMYTDEQASLKNDLEMHKKQATLMKLARTQPSEDLINKHANRSSIYTQYFLPNTQ